jgi:small membrane protein
MKPIQAILVLILLAIAGLYFNRLRKKSFDRLIILVFIFAGIMLVIAPDLTTAIAHILGVGRGADLIMYLGLLTLSFFCLLLYARIRELEASLTDLARWIALDQARGPDQAVMSAADGAEIQESKKEPLV